ncbi:MAG: DNA methyltransferase [Kingella sp. (in: b-proteobacteria)]
MRVLALFDDGGQSVRHALQGVHDVISVGLAEKDTVIKLDLSDLSSLKTIEKMHREQPFDLVLASPPCESWSFATASRGGNAYRFSDSLKLKNFMEWKENTFNNIRRIVEKNPQDLRLPEMFCRYWKTGLNGEKTAFVTAQIVKTLNVPFLIENPQSSMIWRYFEMLGLDLIHNKANYCAYDNKRSLKPTHFSGSLKLDLKTGKPQRGVVMKTQKGRGDGSERANIPRELILDIVRQVKAA